MTSVIDFGLVNALPSIDTMVSPGRNPANWAAVVWPCQFSSEPTV